MQDCWIEYVNLTCYYSQSPLLFAQKETEQKVNLVAMVQ